MLHRLSYNVINTGLNLNINQVFLGPITVIYQIFMSFKFGF